MPQHYSDPSRESNPTALPDIEVFEIDHGNTVVVNDEGEPFPPGWYWWSCFPGCLPDGEALGPFDTEAEALANAREGMEE
jgi:hypothetical protein